VFNGAEASIIVPKSPEESQDHQSSTRSTKCSMVYEYSMVAVIDEGYKVFNGAEGSITLPKGADIQNN
jgi:hypothetical protein